MNSESVYTEKEILAGVAKSNVDVFSYVMQVYYPVICHFAAKITSNKASAEDIGSETFIQLWQHPVSFDSVIGLKKYLYTITRHNCLNYLRAESRKTHRETEFATRISADKDEEINNIIRAEVWGAIHEAVGSLPEKMQQVLRMGYLEGLKNQEIADLLHISLNTVKAHKRRAIELLKLRFKDSDILPLLLLLITSAK